MTMRSGSADSEFAGVVAGNLLGGDSHGETAVCGNLRLGRSDACGAAVLGAKGALESGHEAEVFLMGEAVYLMKTEVCRCVQPGRLAECR